MSNNSKNQITLQLSVDEYKQLLIATQIAAWVLPDEDALDDLPMAPADLRHFDKLEQKVFAADANQEFANLIGRDLVEQEYYATRELDELSFALIEAYDEEVLYEKLAYKLAHRDLARAFSANDFEKMGSEKIATELSKRLRFYHHEFGNYGLDRMPELAFEKVEGSSRNESCPCGSGKKFKKCCGG